MKIFNSLTKKKEVFHPLLAGQIRLYVCGMTVYDHSHIGHARSLIVFDMVVRYFKMREYQVIYVRNITDIDDKIIRRAQENNETPAVLAARFIDALHEDQRGLRILPPDHEPRATQYIPQMIQLIQTLLDHQYAYISPDGHVYFDVRRYQSYGQLSQRNIEALKAGTRVELDANKRDPLDFVLWKLSDLEHASWPSPWGLGRPGWHIECSAMATDILGQPFDIHGGGLDLKFPHHENEIAQSESVSQQSFAKLWMHVGLVEMHHEKMSKSIGNIVSINEALKNLHTPEILRYFLLSAHYRSPLNYSQEGLSQAGVGLGRLYRALSGLSGHEVDMPASLFTERFYAAMDDDFNTALALSILFEMARDVNRLRDSQDLQAAQAVATELKSLGHSLGLLEEEPEAYFKGRMVLLDEEEIALFVAQRDRARAQKNWAESDRIRDQLQERGIIIEDLSDGSTRWRYLQP